MDICRIGKSYALPHYQGTESNREVFIRHLIA